MRETRGGAGLRLTRRGRVARTALVFGAGVFATVTMLGSGDDPADALADAPVADSSAASATATAATTAATSADVSTDATASPKVIVGFGDSVPSGAACHCTNFVSVYAKRLPGTASVANFAKGGSTSADVLTRLGEPHVAAAVRRATTVLIMTGANDFIDSFADVTDGADPDGRYAPVAARVRRNVTAEVKKVHRLNPHAHVVVLDYWAAMQDGVVAQRTYNAAELRAANQATSYLNAALAKAAKASGASYVSTLKAFKGADGKADPTPLLASDGDHPNAAGHIVIAHAIKAVLPRG